MHRAARDAEAGMQEETAGHNARFTPQTSVQVLAPRLPHRLLIVRESLQPQSVRLSPKRAIHRQPHMMVAQHIVPRVVQVAVELCAVPPRLEAEAARAGAGVEGVEAVAPGAVPVGGEGALEDLDVLPALELGGRGGEVAREMCSADGVADVARGQAEGGSGGAVQVRGYLLDELEGEGEEGGCLRGGKNGCRVEILSAGGRHGEVV